MAAAKYSELINFKKSMHGKISLSIVAFYIIRVKDNTMLSLLSNQISRKLYNFPVVGFSSVIFMSQLSSMKRVGKLPMDNPPITAITKYKPVAKRCAETGTKPDEG